MNKLAVMGVGIAAVVIGAQARANGYAVEYSAAELASASGVQSVYERIEKEARRYCPQFTQVRSVSRVAACNADVIADLVDKIDNARLTEYHERGSELRLAARAPRLEVSG